MGDYSDKWSSESEDMGSQTSQISPTPDRSSSGTTHQQLQQTQEAKTCTDCGTTKTPLWRGGPAGPKSLCNACGIRSRKRRRALLGLNTKAKDERKNKKVSTTAKKNSIYYSKDSDESTSTSADSTIRLGLYGDSLRGGKLVVFGRDVALQRPRSKPNSNSQRRRLGEEEQAAFLLMSLSRGCVYA